VHHSTLRPRDSYARKEIAVPASEEKGIDRRDLASHLKRVGCRSALGSRLIPVKCNAAELFWTVMEPTSNRLHYEENDSEKSVSLTVIFSL
jgi:hypothetical protein